MKYRVVLLSLFFLLVTSLPAMGARARAVPARIQRAQLGPSGALRTYLRELLLLVSLNKV